MAFADKLKKMASDYDIAGKANQAKEKAAQLAEQNRDKITTGLDKAGQAADKQTGGKYSSQISKAKGAALKGVDKVADQNAGETAAHRTVGQDGLRTGDDVRGESPVERAVGADATTTSLDPNSPDRIATEEPSHLGQASEAGNTTPGENEPTTDPEINDPHARPQA